MWNEIEKILKKKKMSIYKLAKLTGIPDTSLHNYKNGSQLSFVNACKIADALGVSLDDLRGGIKDANHGW